MGFNQQNGGFNGIYPLVISYIAIGFHGCQAPKKQQQTTEVGIPKMKP